MSGRTAGVRERSGMVLEAFAFWTAVGFPLLYLPLLATGLDTPARLGAFLGVLAANVAALSIGRRYGLE